jgi:glycosyltransferase involved in cell wall biosynthesis
MNAPEVSIVMPVLNAANTLSAAIESILGQSFSCFEFVVCDDGSTDTTLEVARSYATRDRRMRVIHRDHRGIVPALREACALAKGRYLARMDADDIAHPKRLEKQFALMEANPGIGLCGVHVQMAGGTIGIGRRRYERWINALDTHEAIVREMFVECPVAHPTFFLRRNAYEAVGGYQDAGWAEDYDLIMRMWLTGHRFGKVGEVLLDWHERPARHS